MVTRCLATLAVLGLLACGGSAGQRRADSAAAARPTCLVFSIGGPAGLAQLGAVAELQRHGLSVECVVGNSVGALMGALYASAPDAEPVQRFRELRERYLRQTEREAGARAGGLGLLGLVLLGPAGALAGGAVGAASVEPLEHARLQRVLDEYLQGVAIERLPLPFHTSFVRRVGQKAVLEEVGSGNLARAVGASLANPFIFRELDVRAGGPIDPGIDRVAAVPIEQACASFPHTAILALNVSGQTPFVSPRMHCPAFEVAIDVPALDTERALRDEAVLASLVARGRATMRRWLSGPEGQRFLARALRKA